MLGIIGGTGLNTFDEFELIEERRLDTPYGNPSTLCQIGRLNDTEICFLARHGQPHSIPPHAINYRANIYAMREIGVVRVLGINAVGGIHDHLAPGEIAIPDQILDYTYSRDHTFYDGSSPQLEHIDFTEPYSQPLRKALLCAAKSARINVLPGGTYAATQGPRLESAAEIIRIREDGGDMVGMTGMPEAALAREAGLEYASIAVSVNWAAGLCGLAPITMEQIKKALVSGMKNVHAVINELTKA